MSRRSDLAILFATRILRLLAYGGISIILVLYLTQLGYSEGRVGLLLTLTLLGDTAISLFLTTRADRFGRRKTLIAGALLMLGAGISFALTGNFALLTLAAIIGVISPSGNEVGPFLSIEQAALSHVVTDQQRTHVFAWYALAGALSTATGALIAGVAVKLLQKGGYSILTSFRAVLFAYSAIGFAMILLFLFLSKQVEVVSSSDPTQVRFGLHKSKRIVVHLASLFAIDAFGGGFVIQSFLAYWFHVRFNIDIAQLGGIFFGANALAGFSALLAAKIAKRFGLINTMVFTHLPSNFLLMLVPIMPNAPLAITLLLIRFSISQMDVPTRQSYTVAVVHPDERSAAAGITGVARTCGSALSPVLTGVLMRSPALMGAPFLISGTLKAIYDILLYRSFVTLRPPEEK